MFKIRLINMPFAALHRPSIGMTQLKAVLDQRFEGRVATDILYLNHDFAHYIGRPFYGPIADSMEHHSTGLGDWLFRQSAFPHLPDNTEAYFKRFYPAQTERFRMFKRVVQEKRAGLEKFFDSLIEKYKIDDADVVGFGSTFAQTTACIAMMRKLKERDPRITTIMGGANCEAAMGRELVSQLKNLDYAFSGPALKSLPQFVQHILNEEPEKCHKINGVFSKLNCAPRTELVTLGSAPQQPVAEIGEELDINTKIDLNYDQFLRALKDNFGGKTMAPVLPFETSRGCWWGERAHCTFCGLNGGSMNYRAMNPDLAINLLTSLFKYSSEVPVLECVDNIMPRNYVTDVFPYIKTPSSQIIFYEVKADLTEEEVRVLSEANVKTIQPGIEALATSTLKLMKKGTSAFQNLILLKNCATYEILPSWNLLIGFPGEGEDVYKKYVADLPLLTHLFPPSGAFPVRFDRFSPYFTKAKEYGLDLRPMDFYEMIFPFSKESLENLAYYFADQNFRAEYMTTMVKWVGPIREQVEKWTSLWGREGTNRQPKLYFRDNGQSTVVFDSRTGKPVEHEVGATGRQVLECLNKAKALSTVAKELSHIPDFNPEKEIALLQERGLVFEEDRRYLNLVHLREPPTTGMK
ncbi:MAG: RiPP maturation radical SAM C-methyltransferase [Pyrinomonadaceae bacterium]